jgi:hypothetical protein
VDYYWAIALMGQMLGGVVMAVGVIVGLRLALPSFARALAREMDAARYEGVEAAVDRASASGRPVVTLEPRDELRNGA